MTDKRAVPADDDHDAAIVRKRAVQRQEDDEQYGLDHASLEEDAE